MSRHRIVRNYIDVDSEYYDDEVFGHSVEDDSPLSPSLNQFIYNRGSTDERYGLGRQQSVDCVQEEELEEAGSGSNYSNSNYSNQEGYNEAVDQMCEVLDTQFELETCKEALSMYDNDVGRALDHVMQTQEHHVGRAQSQEPAPGSGLTPPEQLATAIHHRLQVRGGGDTLRLSGGDNTPTNCRTPTNCHTPVKSNTPKGSPPTRKKELKDPSSTPTATPKAKKSRPKDIDVLGILNSTTDSKPLVNIAVVGHVDAGKSTLMGHLLCLLGKVSQRELHRNKMDSQKAGKGSFAYAWVLDETGEERERGVTIDVAQTRFETPKRLVNLLDAPGHRDFVPNMISGAAQADIAILVVDSTLGGFEAGFDQGGQTREHVILVRALGVQNLVVAVNKMENVAWSKDRFDAIQSELLDFFRTVGFKKSEVWFVPVSGMEGENLLQRSAVQELVTWYSGDSLVGILDEIKPPKRAYDNPFRFVVTDVFKHPQQGLSVAGKVDAGYVVTGTPLVIMPEGTGTMVKSITVDDAPVDYTVAGEQGVLVLGGIEQTKVHNGNILCESHSRVRSTLKFRARVLVFNIDIPITKGFPVDLHYQTVSEPAVISRLISVHSKSTGEVIKTKPRCLTKNQVALIEMKVERAVCLELFKSSKSLGRITCRYGGSTIAAGMVVEIT